MDNEEHSWFHLVKYRLDTNDACNLRLKEQISILQQDVATLKSKVSMVALIAGGLQIMIGIGVAVLVYIFQGQ